MIPRRSVVRALPKTSVRGHLSARNASSRTLRSVIGNSRQFGTSRNGITGGMAVTSGLRAKVSTAALALGPASSSRAFSLWGYGSKKSAEEASTPPAAPTEAVASAPATTTTPSPPADIASNPTAELDLGNAPANMDLSSITDLVSQQENILTMPENIGYLHKIGLDYGYGPTSVMQWIVEHIHVYSGWGWGASIVATALVVRVLMFYPQVISMQNAGKMTIMKQDPRHEEVMARIKAGQAARNMAEMQKGQYLSKKLREEYGVSIGRGFIGLAQLPFTFGLFRLVTGMSTLPVPAFENAGFFWFTDLTQTDPYFLLPLGAAGFMIGGMKLMNKYSAPEQKAMMKPLMYIMGPLVVIGTSFLSAGVNLMGIAFGAATYAQAVLLNIPSIRRALNIPTPNLPSTATIPTTASYQAPRGAANSQPAAPSGLKERLEKQLDEAKKGFSNQMGNMTGRFAATEEEKAEQKRKAAIRSLEEKRKQQEREEFMRKYKGGRK
ncbi:hypothetical protein NLU13_9587 [Sarocladium strictum]|uniref:Membrane insertase YidC/Oxa/ALB C-terminal domain-containing protein n=1 Tax=Sarocladium strictum TaxID=5046 RepID=A0AA39GAR0_SARSR|nr:hypothetical protein NLU13_9587 [Sarocladium strictum]